MDESGDERSYLISSFHKLLYGGMLKLLDPRVLRLTNMAAAEPVQITKASGIHASAKYDRRVSF